MDQLIVEPPMKVQCRQCREVCGAKIVKVKAFGKEFKKWEFSCVNFKCELGFGAVQHKAKAR